MQLLVERNAAPGSNEYGHTPPPLAVDNRHMAAVKLLRAIGRIGSEIRNSDRRTPLLAAHRGDMSVVTLLAWCGPKAKRREGR